MTDERGLNLKEGFTELPSDLKLMMRMLENAEVEHEYLDTGDSVVLTMNNGVQVVFDGEENLTTISTVEGAY